MLALLLRSATSPVTPQVDAVAQETLTGATGRPKLPAAPTSSSSASCRSRTAKYSPKLTVGELLLPLTEIFSPVSTQNADVAQATRWFGLRRPARLGDGVQRPLRAVPRLDEGRAADLAERR